jgi:hypothetical protein
VPRLRDPAETFKTMSLQFLVMEWATASSIAAPTCSRLASYPCVTENAASREKPGTPNMAVLIKPFGAPHPHGQSPGRYVNFS